MQTHFPSSKHTFSLCIVNWACNLLKEFHNRILASYNTFLRCSLGEGLQRERNFETI